MNKLKKIVAKAMNKRASLTKNAAPLYYPNESKTFEEEKGKIKVTIKRVDDHNSILVNIQIEPEDPRKKIFSFDGIIRPVLNEQKGWGDYNDINEYLKDTMIYENKEDFKGYGNYIGNTIRELIEIVDGIPALNKKAQKNKANKLASIISKEILKSAKVNKKAIAESEYFDIIEVDENGETIDIIESDYTNGVSAVIEKAKEEAVDGKHIIVVNRYTELDEDGNEFVNDDLNETVWDSEKDVEIERYGVEFRNMNKGYYNIIITDTEEKAKEILKYMEELEDETDEKEIIFIWEDINSLTIDTIEEINTEKVENLKGIYKGIKVINYNGNIPQLWLY